MERSLLVLCVAVALSGCTKAQTHKPCPEARQTQCMTRVECSYDAERDCEVCHCSAPTPHPLVTK